MAGGESGRDFIHNRLKQIEKLGPGRLTARERTAFEVAKRYL